MLESISVELEQSILNILNHDFNDLSAERLKVIDKGWVHTIVIVDNKTVYRFAKNAEVAIGDKKEAGFLKLFSPSSPLLVPDMHLYHDEGLKYKTYQVYNFIPGVEFTQAQLSGLNAEQVEWAAADLAKFLVNLHSTDLDKTRTIGFEEIPMKVWWQNIYEDIRKKVFPVVSTEIRQKIEHMFSNLFQTLETNPSVNVVIHGDFSSDQIFIDQKKVSGVIDFEDVMISDPAYDLQLVISFGIDFADKVIERYQEQSGVTDQGLRLRARAYESMEPVTSLYHQVLGLNPENQEEILERLLAT